MREFSAAWLILYSVLVSLLKFVGEIFRLNFIVQIKEQVMQIIAAADRYYLNS